MNEATNREKTPIDSLRELVSKLISEETDTDRFLAAIQYAIQAIRERDSGRCYSNIEIGDKVYVGDKLYVYKPATIDAKGVITSKFVDEGGNLCLTIIRDSKRTGHDPLHIIIVPGRHCENET